MSGKLATLVVLLLLTAWVVRVRAAKQPVVEGRTLRELPLQVGSFAGKDQPIGQDVLQVLGDGRFLSRSYQSTGGGGVPLDLLIAFYPTQRNGQSIHSPQNCLPGAGWTFEHSGAVTFDDINGHFHRVAEYLVQNGGTRMEVLYWYRSGGRDIANDYAAKAFLMMTAVRDGRTDGGLIRIMTPLRQGESQEAARSRAIGFASSLTPLLPPFLPN